MRNVITTIIGVSIFSLAALAAISGAPTMGLCLIIIGAVVAILAW